MTLPPPPDAPPGELVAALVQKAFRRTLHRLRGTGSLLEGWVQIGVPPGSEGAVHARLEEHARLIARLDWLGSLLAIPPPPERLEAGEAPGVLLAAALGHGTPEEAGARLPRILEPRAAAALALWTQAKIPDGAGADAHLHWEGRVLAVEIAAPRAADFEWWDQRYGGFALRREPHALRMRPGCFAPDEAEAAGAAD